MFCLRNKIFTLIQICTVMAFSIWYSSYSSQQSTLMHKIPALEITDEDGNSYNMKQFEGQVVILYFWASWCIECVDEVVQLNKLKQKLIYENINNVEIIPISIDFKNTKALTKIYHDSNINNIGLFLDTNKSVMRGLSVSNVPTSIILSPKLEEIGRHNYNIKWSSKENVSSIIAKSKEFS